MLPTVGCSRAIGARVISPICFRHCGCNSSVAVSPRLLVALAVLAGCAGDAPPRSPEDPSPDGGTDPGDTGNGDPDGGTAPSDPFDAAALGARVTQLSTGACADRAAGTPGDKQAADVIAGRFAALGLQTQRQPFTDAAGHATENVIALAPAVANAKDAIVIGAHRDTLPANGTTQFPGANANATGSAALLAIGEALAAKAPAKRQVILVSFGAGEGPVAAGASYFLQQLPPDAKAGIVLMVDLDMLGTYSAQDTVFALGASTSPTGRAVLEDRGGASFPLLLDLDSAADGSDHVPFCTAGIPYTVFYTPDPDCYHKACDTPDRVETDTMAQIAQLAAQFTSDLATSTADLAGERAANGCVDR